jgi:hypothetical protein
MELITLSQRICGKADQQLRSRINDQAKSLRTILSHAAHGNNWFINVSGCDKNDARHTLQLHWVHLLDALLDGLFEQMAPEARQEAIDDFLRNLEKPNPPTP